MSNFSNHRPLKGREVLVIGLFLFCLTLLFFWKVTFLGQTTVAADLLGQWDPWRSSFSYNQPHNTYLSDNIIFNYPLKFYSSWMVRMGQLPLWDPYLLCGTPFLAMGESAIFNPLNIIFYLFPGDKTFGYSNILQLFLAGLFMYLFLRTIRVSSLGSLVASIVFMFNGFFIVWLEHQNLVAVGLWLPLILLFLEKAIKEKKFLYAILGGIVLALQFLAGFIQVSLYLLIGVLIYGLVRIFQIYCEEKSIASLTHRLVYLGLVFLIGFALAAIQLIPTFELIPLSQRPVEPYRFQFVNLSVLIHLISFIAPDVFGNVNNYWGAINYVELCGYIGVLPLILTFFALFGRRDKLSLTFFLIALFSLLVYLRTPLQGLLYLIPGYSRGLSSSRIIFLWTFSGSVLAGLGADYLVTERVKPKVKLLNRIILGCIIVGVVFFLLGNLILRMGRDYIVNQARNILSLPIAPEPGFKLTLQSFLKQVGTFYPQYLKYYSPFSPAAYVPFLFLGASALAFLLYLKKGASLSFRVFLVLIVVVDLFYFGMKYLTFVDPEIIYPEVESVKFLKKDTNQWRALGLGEIFPPNTMVPYKIQSIEGIESLFPGRYEDFMSLVDKEAIIRPGNIGIRTSQYDSPLLDLLNVKYIFSKSEIKNEKFNLIYDREIRIYENRMALPRAFLVSKAKLIKEKEDILRELASKDFNPREYIIIEEELKRPLTPISLEGSGISITHYSPNRVLIETNLSNDGFLVLNDSYYPGWKVFVDGKEDRILRANYILRAVYLIKGKHRVEFLYDSFSFRAGKYISLFTLFSVVLFIAGKGGFHLFQRRVKRNETEH